MTSVYPKEGVIMSDTLGRVMAADFLMFGLVTLLLVF